MLTGRCEVGVDDVSQLSVKLKSLPTAGAKRVRKKDRQTDRGFHIRDTAIFMS